MLFSERSLWTMVHGIGLGGGALLGLAAAMFYLYASHPPMGTDRLPVGSRALAGVTAFTAALLWLTVLVGTYVVFPPYRATPPAGLADLSQFPRALVLSNPGTAWLHAFAMESKEHMPWIASMLATAVAFVCVRHPSRVLHDAPLRRMALSFLAIALALVAFVSLLGVFVNKVAPLQ
ncbi:MAG: hypothetical protein Q8L86_08590 [Vicinamibacterales bacterium]|nr:hypothetical protein [Vicinamibacterales bacterium]